MQIKKLTLQSSAINQLSGFYRELMGLPVDVISENEIGIRIGSSELVFTKATTADPFYHLAFNIPANKIEQARDWLIERLELLWIEQYESDIADFVNWHAKSVYFFDPAGNILELIARFDLNNQTDQDFSRAQFLSINEVGLVFKDQALVRKTEELMHRYRLPYFDKQPPLPQFKAVGDDEGLFIIVPDKRNWFPTTKPSGIFPLKVAFQSNNEHFELEI